MQDRSTFNIRRRCSTDLAALDIVDPTCDDGLLQNERMVLEKLDIALYTRLQVAKFQKVDRVDCLSNFCTRVLLLDNVAKLRCGKGEHSAVSVMEYCYFTRSQETLGDYNVPNRILAEQESKQVDGSAVDRLTPRPLRCELCGRLQLEGQATERDLMIRFG